MNKSKYLNVSVIAIPLVAFPLFMVGCGDSNSSVPKSTTAINSNHTNMNGPIPTQNLRECTNEEFSKLQKWSFVLLDADNLIIKEMGDNPQSWIKKSQIVSAATSAVRQCDALEFYHSMKPCKKTTKNIVATSAKGYDAYTIRRRCSRVTSYLEKFNIRPIANDSSADQDVLATEPAQQPQPAAPVTIRPQPDTSTINSSNLRECSSEEFSKLNQYKSNLDKSNKALAVLGAANNWKYDTQAISTTTATTRSCEGLIQTFQNSGCKKTIKDSKLGVSVKTYTGASIRQECHSARTYYYEFTQRQQDLIMPNANLMLDTKLFSNTTFAPGYSTASFELCVVTNNSQSTIKYNGEKTLVAEARVYPTNDSHAQMFVMLTKEGLKIECYGLNYQGASTSLNEVRRLLKASGLSIGLNYELK